MAAVKAMKAMKAAKAMKAMKAKRVSKIAKGSRAKVAVFLGNKEKTYTGLKKSDLVKNKVGRIVCKKAEGLQPHQGLDHGRAEGSQGPRS